MKITDVRIKKFETEYEKPFCVTFGTLYTAESWIVKLFTDEGTTGLGSAAPFQYVTGDTADICKIALDILAEALLGCDPLDIKSVHERMDSVLAGNHPAKCAYDIACYDIASRKAGLPLYRYLGGTNPCVLDDITIGIDDPVKMAQEAQRLVFEKDFHILKVKTGIDPDQDMKALKMIGEYTEGRARIRADANQGYDVPTTLAVLERMEAIGVEALEQPLPWWDFKGMAEIKRRNRTRVMLMMDESIRDVHDADRAAEMNCADNFNIKLMKCGGVFHGLEIADRAAQSGITCMIGSMPENKISLTAGLSIVAAHDAVIESDCDMFMLYKGEDDGIEGGFTHEGGDFRLLEAPGLGIELNI